MKLRFLHIVFVFFSFSVFGQQLNAVLDKQKIQIGEPFVLTLTVEDTKPLGKIDYQIHSQQFPGKLSLSLLQDDDDYEVEVLAVGKDTNFQEGDKYYWEMQYELTGWDSAFVILPPERIKIDDSLYYFPGQLIEVEIPVAIPNKDIYDINEYFTDIPSTDAFVNFLKANWWWLAIAVIVIILSALLIKKRTKKELAELSLKEKALIEINLLEEKKGYQTDLKEYYFELSLILRRFLGQYYQTPIVEKTTSQIERLLLSKKLSPKLVELIAKLLRESDMVKFAQSNPTVSEIHSVTNEARRVINEIPEIEVSHEQ